MTNQNTLNLLIGAETYPHIVIPKIAAVIGTDAAVILQQMHYWIQKLGNIKENRSWIRNSYESFHKQFFYLSICTIKRIIYMLEKKGYILSKKMYARQHNHTKWYSLNYDAIEAMLEEGELKKQKVQQTSPGRYSDQAVKEENNSNLEPIKSIDIEESYIQNGTCFNKSPASTTEKQKKLFLKKERKNSITPTKEVESTITESEKALCDTMIETWNKTFIKEGFKTTYTDKRAKKFLELWHGIMEQNIEKWKDFCLKINSSQFLMGEKVKSFKAYCDWVLKEEIANRIMAGEFNIGDRVPEIIAEAKRIAAEEFHVLQLQERVEKARKEEQEKKIRSLSWELREEAIDKIMSEWSADKREEMESEFEQYIHDLGNSMLQDWYRKERFNNSFVELHFGDYILEKTMSVQDRAFEEKARRMVTEVICVQYSDTQGCMG